MLFLVLISNAMLEMLAIIRTVIVAKFSCFFRAEQKAVFVKLPVYPFIDFLLLRGINMVIKLNLCSPHV